MGCTHPTRSYRGPIGAGSQRTTVDSLEVLTPPSTLVAMAGSGLGLRRHEPRGALSGSLTTTRVGVWDPMTVVVRAGASTADVPPSMISVGGSPPLPFTGAAGA